MHLPSGHPLLLPIATTNDLSITYYEEPICEVERASFTPLVFTTSGGASPLTTMFLKHLASHLAEKRDLTYSNTLGWLRVRLNFSLLWSAIICIRGSRSTVGRACIEHALDLATSDAQLAIHSTFPPLLSPETTTCVLYLNFSVPCFTFVHVHVLELKIVN